VPDNDLRARSWRSIHHRSRRRRSQAHAGSTERIGSRKGLIDRGTSDRFQLSFNMPGSVQCNASASWVVGPAYNEEFVIAGVLNAVENPGCAPANASIKARAEFVSEQE
jgi:hypothetical protein